MRDAALRLNKKYGWALFPADLRDGAKKSYLAAEHALGGERWGMARTPSRLKRIFTDERYCDECGIGIPTGADNGIFVIETDTKKGGHKADGAPTLQALERERGKLPSTLMAESPSGSVHRYFKHPGAQFTVKTTDNVVPGVDVRGDGGMVVAPPSKRDDGVYRWLNDEEIAEAPQWLLHLVTETVRDRSDNDADAEMTGGEIAAAYAVIPNNDDVGWNEWNDKGMAGWRANRDDGFFGFDAWSRKYSGYNARDTLEKWLKYYTSPPTKITAASLIHWADEADPNWRDAYYEKIYDDWGNDVAKERRQQQSNGQRQQVKGVVVAKELNAMQFEDIRYVVPGIIVEGLTLLAGKPKIGKSWLLLSTAIAVSCGGVAFGQIECDQGDVLYCALEDNLRRLQSRMHKLLDEIGLPWPERLFFRTEMPRLGEGGLQQIGDWIASVKHPRLIIIDTLAMVRAVKKRDQSSYDADYESVKALRDLAGRHNVAIVIVHHLRKALGDDPFDTVSGTLGLTGAPDSILVIKHDPGGYVLHGRGRDLSELEKMLAFNKDACTWSIVGEAEDVRRSTERRAILAALSTGDELGPQQIADITGMKSSNVRFLLYQMLNDGEIKKTAYGKYCR
jgi:hypothetical protein